MFYVVRKCRYSPKGNGELIINIVGTVTNKVAWDGFNPPPEGCNYIAQGDFARWVKGQLRDLAEAKRGLDSGHVSMDMFVEGS